MKTLAFSLLLAAAAVNCPAQQWEVGGVGGGSFLNTTSVSSPAGAATAGFRSGFVGGGFFGQNLYPHLTGEIRYEYFQSNLQISSGNTSATFSGMAHAIHYDMIIHTERKDRPVQYFAAIGGGMKIFQGTGAATGILMIAAEELETELIVLDDGFRDFEPRRNLALRQAVDLPELQDLAAARRQAADRSRARRATIQGPHAGASFPRRSNAGCRLRRCRRDAAEASRRFLRQRHDHVELDARARRRQLIDAHRRAGR